MSCCHHLAIALALTHSALGSAAQSSSFGKFVPLASSVAATALPESSPFQFGMGAWTQRSIADRAKQLAAGQFNSGSWDMIDSNRTGVDVGRHLFMGLETGQARIQRYDRLTGTMTTLWNAPTAGTVVNFDAAPWTPFGTYLTAESGGAQPRPYGRLFEQVLYGTATTTHEVYSINLATQQILNFVSRATIDAAAGQAVGAALTNPDNMAIDADGNIYIVEYQPAGQADIWVARDAHGDDVAESVSRWATLSTLGAEPAGLYFDVSNPNVAFVNMQHPRSGVDRLIEVAVVPEPASNALMLAGLGAVGVVVLRRSPT